jgi:hypothetical protein
VAYLIRSDDDRGNVFQVAYMKQAEEKIREEFAVEKRYLPRDLRDIADLIGVVPTMQLVRRYGGTRLYFPINLTKDHPLSKLIGYGEMLRLVQYAGDSIEIPRATIAIQAARDKQIRAESLAGESQAALAVRYNLTERWIRSITAGEKGRVAKDRLTKKVRRRSPCARCRAKQLAAIHAAEAHPIAITKEKK